jgi:hypothetical protein
MLAGDEAFKPLPAQRCETEAGSIVDDQSKPLQACDVAVAKANWMTGAASDPAKRAFFVRAKSSFKASHNRLLWEAPAAKY